MWFFFAFDHKREINLQLCLFYIESLNEDYVVTEDETIIIDKSFLLYKKKASGLMSTVFIWYTGTYTFVYDQRIFELNNFIDGGIEA